MTFSRMRQACDAAASRVLAFALATVLAVGFVPAVGLQALAQESDPEVLTCADLPTYYISGEACTFAVELDDANQQLYDELKAFVQDVAVNGGSTEFDYAWNYSGEGEGSSAGAYEVLSEGLSELDIDGILSRLLAECPYEMYWYDKTSTGGLSYGASGATATTTDGVTYTWTISTLSFYFSPTSAYAGSESYTVDEEAAAYASQVVASAQNFVNSCTEVGSVYELLTIYAEYILDLTSYDEEAADSDVYDDAYQLIYVFDGDDDTAVVCEGYAKAFQYLCQLTWDDSELECYSVSGTMSGGTGAGNHMWNIVRIDGESYLVDLTNSDEGTPGAAGELILASAEGASGSATEGYTFDTVSPSMTYVYSSTTLALYGEEALTLSDTAFDAYDDHEHSYVDEWTWADDYSSATVTLTCEVCGESVTLEATVTSTTTVEPTATTAGSCTYTATVTYEEVEYTIGATVEIDPLGTDEDNTDDGDTGDGDTGDNDVDLGDDADTGDDDADDDGSEEATGSSYSFEDVTDSAAWYYDSIYQVAELGLMTGTSSTVFGRTGNLTRAQLAVVFWRIAEPEAAAAYDADDAVSTTTTVSGIADGKYYTAAADWAVAEGVINGKEASDGSRYFDPSGTVTFQEFCAVLANYIDPDGRDSMSSGLVLITLLAFDDADSVSEWAYASVAWCVSNGVVNGNDDGTLGPKTKIKRQRAAVMLANAVNVGALEV